MTAFSIIAVDFKIFPRYFAKAETYGTGLMDVGVGCFMISNAIVSPEARGKVSSDKYVSTIFFLQVYTSNLSIPNSNMQHFLVSTITLMEI